MKRHRKLIAFLLVLALTAAAVFMAGCNTNSRAQYENVFGFPPDKLTPSIGNSRYKTDNSTNGSEQGSDSQSNGNNGGADLDECGDE